MKNSINLVFFFLFLITFAFVSCDSSSESLDGKVYQIYIKNQNVNSNKNYTRSWDAGDAAKMKNAKLYECQNIGYEYGHVTIATWDDFDELKTAYASSGKPKNKLHRAYKKIGEEGDFSKEGDHYVIVVFDLPQDILGHNDLKPNWDIISKWMKNQKGFVGAEFYECLSPDVNYRYVNVAKWTNLIDMSKIEGDENNFFNEVMNNSNVKSKANIYKIVKQKNH